MRLIASVALVPLCLSTFGQTPRGRNLADAASKNAALPPSAFRELPRNIMRELQRRRCTIPQTGFTNKQENVIRGEFEKPGQTDWAVLCSAKGASTILVFWNGSEKRPAEIGRFEDTVFLQQISPDKTAYSREIAPVGRDFIMRHYKAYGGPKPPPMNHQGVDDAVVEKGSSVWYFYRRNWLRLTGSD